jgi:hypothetical protein
MPIDFSNQLYINCQDTFARAIIFFPSASQPGQPNYHGRGIFDTAEIDVVALDGSIVSEQRTILDVRDVEFEVVPAQGDTLIIPADGTLPEAGSWEVTDASKNGGGETTLTLRKLMPAKPNLKVVTKK